jgi:hypothetical protein
LQASLLIGVAVKAGRQAFIDGRQQRQHHGRAGIDEPVRHRPKDLLATGERELIRLIVAAMVALLIDGDDQLNRRGQYGAIRLGLVAERFRHALARFWIGDDDHVNALREAACWTTQDRGHDPLHCVFWNGIALIAPDHPPPSHHLLELHVDTSSGHRTMAMKGGPRSEWSAATGCWRRS